MNRAQGPILKFALQGPHGLAEYVRRPGDDRAVYVRATTRAVAERAGLPVLSSAAAELRRWL